MATIANIAVQLTANAQEYMQTMSAAEARLNKFAEAGRKIAPMLASPFTSAAGVIRAAARTMVSPFTGALDMVNHAFQSTVNLLSSIPIVGQFFAAIPTSIKGFIDVIKQQIGEMAATSREAKRMGLSVESLIGIQFAAGGASEQMAKGLFHLHRLLGEVSAGSKQAEKMFANLGLDGKALAAMPLEQSLAAIMDKMQGLASPAERAYLAFKLFGKSGYELVPMLSKGSAGLAEAAQRAKDFGLAFDDQTAAGMEKARRALASVDLLAKGLQRQFAIEMAPIVATIAEGFVKWVKGMGGAKPVFSWIADKVASFLAIAIEGFAELADMIKDMAKQAKGIMDAINPPELVQMNEPERIEQAMQQVRERQAQGETGLGGAIAGGAARAAVEGAPPVPESQLTIGDHARAFAAQLRNRRGFFNQATPAAGTEALPDQHTQEMIEKAGELEEKLRSEIAAFGGASAAIKRMKLAQQGATPEMLKGIDALIAENNALEQITSWASGAGNLFQDYQARVEALQKALDAGTISAEGYAAAVAKLGEGLQKSLAEKAASVFEQTRTPLEKYQNKIQELQGLLQSGNLDWETYQRAVAAASQELINLRKQQENRSPAAVQAGTQEAFKAIVNHDRGTAEKDPVAELKEAMAQQLEAQRRQNAIAERIARAVEKNEKEW
jgi:hypothetical protein